MEINKKVIYINQCKSCGKSLRDDWKYCPFCMVPVETFSCNHCGQEVRTNWNYCPHCTKEISNEQKNKSRVDSCNDWLKEILKNP